MIRPTLKVWQGKRVYLKELFIIIVSCFICSVDMLSEDQIHCLMLDKDLSQVCEQVLGTAITDVVASPSTSGQR